MANWGGSATKFATKQQLISSVNGLYSDIQDFSFSTIQINDLKVSTLSVKDYISAPVGYFSSVSGLQTIDAELLSSMIINNQLTLLSSLTFKVDPTVNFTVQLNVGDATSGFLTGLGAILFSILFGIGAGAGQAFAGIGNGIAAIINARGTNNTTYINNNQFELLGGTTQIQISTLGNAYPLYSSITRLVSSTGAGNEFPGQEIFISSFFNPGTTCIRSISDPYPLITRDSNINTSTIQAFGQWVPFNDETLLGDDISARNAFFSTLKTFTFDNQIAFEAKTFTPTFSNNFLFSTPTIYPVQDVPQNSNIWMTNTTYFSSIDNFISSGFDRFTSTVSNAGATYYVPSSLLSSHSLISYIDQTTSGNIVFCLDPAGNEWLSSGVVDVQTNSFQSTLVQYGVLVNTYLPQGSTIRVSWNYDLGVSSIITAPEALSTLLSTTTQFDWGLITDPYQFQIHTYEYSTGVPSPGGLLINASTMVIGANPASSASNQPGYAYQFNGNTYINGTLEAQTIIATSTIFSFSTIAETSISTNSFEANSATIVRGFTDQMYVSTLYAMPSNNWPNEFITSKSQHRFMGFQTPMAIVTGSGSNFYDQAYRFDFVSDSSPQSFNIIPRPLAPNGSIITFTNSNVQMSNLVVDNLTTNSLIYSNAVAPYIETSTINFGWTGQFSPYVAPQYVLQQSLSTEPGFYWTDYGAASNQVMNLMNFSNTVNMLAQFFSTPLTTTNTQFGASNQQGWASTIFYNAQTTPARVSLLANAGVGELSLQAQTYAIAVSLNVGPGVQGLPVSVPVGSTYLFTSDGTSWTTASNAPVPGYATYQNALQLQMDFENTNLTTTDTLKLNAEKIVFNGQVDFPSGLQVQELYANLLISTTNIQIDTVSGIDGRRNYQGSLNNIPPAVPLDLQYNMLSTDFLNQRTCLIPSRGYNLFNSYNFGEWNNTIWLLDTTPAAGRPTVIVGEVLVTSPPKPPYSGQFWLNNTVDGTPLTVPVYQNVEGVLSTIAIVNGNTFARVYTNDGISWNVQTNVPNPQGSAFVTYSNYYTVGMNNLVTTINAGMPIIYNSPSIIYNNNKTFFYSPQIRVATIDAPSFNSREAGFEYTTYYDSNVIFSYVGPGNDWESSALNPIINVTGNSYYSIAGWMCHIWISRFRNDKQLLSQFDVVEYAYPVGGGQIDYIWGSERYVMCRSVDQPEGNIRENYLLIPKNYYNFPWQNQGPINE